MPGVQGLPRQRPDAHPTKGPTIDDVDYDELPEVAVLRLAVLLAAIGVVPVACACVSCTCRRLRRRRAGGVLSTSDDAEMEMTMEAASPRQAAERKHAKPPRTQRGQRTRGMRTGPRAGCTRINESDEPELGEAGEELDARRVFGLD